MALANPDNPNSASKANRYTFTDSEGLTRIVYLPNLALTLNAPSAAPQLYYSGPEGEFTFTQDDIEQQQSRLGQLITVTLVSDRAEQLDFTLILPAIHLAGQMEREFKTIAIKTKPMDTSNNPAGAALAYEGFALRGVAEVVTVTH
jgi:hypothetical protein